MKNSGLNNRKNDLISEKNLTIIVTAAGNIKSACNYKLAHEDPGFLNIGSTLAIEEIRKNNNFRLILAVKKNLELYKLIPYKNIEIIEIGDTKTITETIEKVLDYVNTTWCLINPITTIPYKNVFNKSFIEFGSKMIPKENWSALKFSDNKYPSFISKSEESSKGLMSYPFTGRILAKKNDLKQAINNIKEFEKNDLINLARSLFKKNKISIKYSEWLDIGHLATYPSTRISSINSRFFNTLIFDSYKNTIKKKSTNKDKIFKEFSFYKNLPDEIKRYFPMVFTMDNNKEVMSYEMEYISKPNLSEIYLFSEIGPNAILRIINSVEMIFTTFYDKESKTSENANWLYSIKTQARQKNIEKIIEQEKYKFFREIYYDDFILNDNRFPSLKKTYDLLKNELINFEKNRPLHLGHGDLCFNNILVDPLYGNLNLIDPKAEKHNTLKKFGMIDNFYDLSKLNHSIEGLYDSVVNNLFKLDFIDNKDIYFQIYMPKEYQIYNSYFKEIILDKRIDRKTLKLLTANLFLSMLPMHIEDNKKIIGLALLGSIFMTELSMEKIIS